MNHQTIILIDDDPALLESFRIILELEGYTLHLAKDGNGLRKLLTKIKPDIIILDFNLPDSNGIDLTVQLKKDRKTKRIPIIIISANHKIQSKVRLAGADEYLEKPFEISTLLSKIKKYLN